MSNQLESRNQNILDKPPSVKHGMAKSDRRIMTVSELAEYLRVNRSTIYKLLKKREIPGFRIGADWRFDREQIERWLESSSSRGFN